jgi:hypothetical protein
MVAGRDTGGDRATTGRTRYTVPGAAEFLGITAEAFRSHIIRGTRTGGQQAAIGGRMGKPEEGRRPFWWRELLWDGE